MEFSILKIELLFTLIEKFVKRLIILLILVHVKERKIQISPPPGEQDHSNAPPQG